MRFRAALFALALSTLPAIAQDQDQATLVADGLRITDDRVLTATGNVEIFYQGQRLRARSVRYDKGNDSLSIEGPLTLDDGKGNVVLADQAELSGDMRDGVLRSARLVLAQQLQLASTEINRIGDRYTRLGKSVASSCKVCASNPVPLWEIRADEIIHDEETRQIYFQNAQLRMFDTPIFYIPRLRMPDPTVERMRGILTPSVRTTSDFGTGLKLPYFFPLGETRDLTLTPYVSSKSTRSLDLRYRQAFNSGWIEVNGAMSRDESLPGETRGYVFATGEFTLPQDYTLKLRVDTVSDSAYFYDYGLEERDRLESSVEITRTRRNEYISGRVLNFHTTRDGETNSTIPSLVGTGTFHRRFTGGPLGGEAGLRFQVYGAERTSSIPYDTDDDDDDDADGRDTQRASIRLDWRRNWILPAGVVGTAIGQFTTDFYNIDQDLEYAGTTTRSYGTAAVELRWPLVKASANGVSHVLEPVGQLVVSQDDVGDIPNEDSTLVEFDESNLFSLDRFSGSDGVEEGIHLNLGMTYTRIDPAGWTLGTTVGRVIRQRDLGQFSNASGLQGQKSDWLAALQVTLQDGLILTNRALFDDDLEVTKAELRMDLDMQRFDVTASYVHVLADEDEDRDDPLSEVLMSTRYEVSDRWAARVSTRYDFEADRTSRAGVGLEFRNECLSMDLSLSRRYSSSDSVTPSTDFGVSVDLLGFGSGKTPGTAGTCSR
ncbi:LPS-assembly protein LptD [Falsirhodobacter algicola]|uniref:LPS-assembly protein LptD n=1 Tax=Falsirhodobacter algicola TaxID=2692330 RepID=A0A8J8SKM2_9RHOB|nr:LPS assembly protein LptD [Falsirhodobacter algicola]QUS35621.1 LPS assembly protein LptD [Falsirhodobacter algicola]